MHLNKKDNIEIKESNMGYETSHILLQNYFKHSTSPPVHPEDDLSQVRVEIQIWKRVTT